MRSCWASCSEHLRSYTLETASPFHSSIPVLLNSATGVLRLESSGRLHDSPATRIGRVEDSLHIMVTRSHRRGDAAVVLDLLLR